MSIEMLTDQFDLLLDAPESMPKLRALILDLAVRGKLVPQDPSDEPAAELLKRIEQEKQRLYEEGTIRKPKKLPAVTDDGEPFELPRGWAWTRLGNAILDIYGGGTPSKRNPAYWDGDIPWASVKDLSNNEHLRDVQDSITQKALEDSSSKLVPAGNVIICTRMGLGKIALNEIDVAINQDLKSLILPTSLERRFFYIWYKTQRVEGSGMTVKGIKQSELLRYALILPPHKEQQRIVAKVDELMQLCDQLEAQHAEQRTARMHLSNAALNALETAEDDDLPHRWQFVHDHFDLLYADPQNVQKLREAVLLLAVHGKLVPQDPSDEPAAELLKRIEQEKQRLYEEGTIRKPKKLPAVTDEAKPFKLPKRWKWVRLGEFISMSTGIAFKSKDYVADGVFVLRVTNIQKDGTISKGNAVFFPEEMIDAKVRKRKLKAGDVLVVMVGGSLGKVGYVTEGDIPALLNQNMWMLRPFGNTLSKPYLRLLIEYINGALIEITSSTHGHLSMSEYKQLVVPLVPLPEQRRIVAKVDELMQLCDELEAGLVQAEGRAELLLEAVLREVLHPIPELEKPVEL